MTTPAHTGSATATPDTPPNGGAVGVRPEPPSAQDAIAEVIESMEQGVLVWSQDAICEMHNQRAFEVLELGPRDLYPGIHRSDFLRMAVARGEFDAETAAKAEKRFDQLAPFSFDRVMPSGSIIATTARPKKSGGFVVTFTDVTEARRKELELEAQREKSRAAELRANEALTHERDRKQEARGLSQLDEWLQSCKSLDELLLIVGRFLNQLFEGSVGELYIYSNSRDVLDGACSWGIDAPKAHIQPDECWGLRRGRLYQYEAGQVNFSCNHVSDIVTDDYDGRYLCIPIIAHGDTVGLLHIRFPNAEKSAKDAAIPQDRVAFAIRCAERISLAIANVKLRDELRDQSTKDPLTGLYNRRHFLDRCRRELSHAERYNQPLGLISLDADSFKKFNDTHGHDAGDMVLRSISDVMMDMFGGTETVARFGGEEFSILLPGMTPEAALERAEALRERIENNVLRYDDRALPKVTISAGVASYPVNGTSPQELLREADRALYQAKDSGRNRVVQAGTANLASPAA